MYEEDSELEDEFENETEEKRDNSNALKTFYNSNKKLIFVLAGIIIFIIIVLIITGLSGNKEKNNEIAINIIGSDIVTKGSSVNLKSTISNNQNYFVEWTSSDESVATVDKSGNVNGVNFGTAIINADMTVGKNVLHAEHTIKVIQGDINVNLVSVNFNEGVLVLNPKFTYSLLATLTPPNSYIENIVYTSTNPNVVTVGNDGLVTGINSGNAEIKITINDKFNDTIKVYVVDEKINSVIFIPIDKFNLNEKNIKLGIGKYHQVNYEIYPINANSNSLIWESLDTSIAMVSNGNIKSLKEGKTTIKVHDILGLINENIEVEVLPNVIPVEKINLITNKKLTLTVGDTKQIEYALAPVDATDKTVNYKTSAKSIAQVDKDGIITALKKGTATISIITSNNIVEKIDVTVEAASNNNNNNGGSGGSSTPEPHCKFSSSTGRANPGYEYGVLNAVEGTSATANLEKGNTQAVKFKYCTKTVTSTDSCSVDTDYNGVINLQGVGIHFIHYVGYDSNGNKVCSGVQYLGLLSPSGTNKIVPGITGNVSSKEVNVGSIERISLIPSIPGSFRITSGPNQNIAKVTLENGSGNGKNLKIEGISQGNTTVTYEFTPNDNNTYDKVSKTISVIVKPSTSALLTPQITGPNVANVAEGYTTTIILTSDVDGRFSLTAYPAATYATVSIQHIDNKNVKITIKGNSFGTTRFAYIFTPTDLTRNKTTVGIVTINVLSFSGASHRF